MKKHWPIIFGVGVPVIFLLVIMSIAFLPELFRGSPSHNVLLTNDKGTDYKEKIENGRLVLVPDEEKLTTVYIDESGTRTETRRDPDPASRIYELYVYNFEDDSLVEISDEEAKKLSLDAGPESDDGYSIGPMVSGNSLPVRGSRRGIFEIFGSRSFYTSPPPFPRFSLPVYRRGNKIVDQIIVPENPWGGGYGYYGELRFLAWIK